MAYNDHDADDPPKMRSGGLKAKAKAAGMSKSAFAQANIHAKTPVGKAARMAYLKDGTHGAGKANMNRPGDNRSLGQRLYQLG